MKTSFSLIVLMVMFAGSSAYAAGIGGGARGGMGGESYSGTGQTRGFTSSTGFVKERGNEPEDKMGKDDDQSGDADGDDVPPSSEEQPAEAK